MSDPGKAVFLSYASQDAEAAKRICEALRAAGVEVWFDQNELVGGDAWDQKIRKQIGSCALFVPIISASTQARAEGYFRLEWKLADRRTDLIGKSKAFLLPVCIDDTKDSEADVPDSFLAVQWTKLRGGEATPAFVTRVQKLLNGDPAQPSASRPPITTMEAESPRPGSRARWPWIVGSLAVISVGIVLVASLRNSRDNPPPPRQSVADTPQKPAAPAAVLDPKVAEARALVAKATPLHENLDAATRADFDLAGDMFKQALALAPLEAEVWANYSWYCSNVYGMGIDRTKERDAEIKRAADRALKLDPQSPMARFAWANYYRRQPGTLDEAIRILRELTRGQPENKVAMLRVLGIALGRGKRDYQEALAVFDQADAVAGGDAHAWSIKGDYLWYLNRPVEAEAAYLRSLAIRVTPRVLTRQAMFRMYQHGDLEGAASLLGQLSGEFLQEDRAVSMLGWLALWQRQPERALEAVARSPRDYLEEGNYQFLSGPKARIKGYAYHLQGKPEAARLEWEQALHVVDRRLQDRRDDVDLHRQRVELLALLGRRAEAEAALRLVDQLAPRQYPWLPDLIDVWNGAVDACLRRREASPPAGDSLISLRYDPQWEPLRQHPRFPALLARLTSP